MGEVVKFVRTNIISPVSNDNSQNNSNSPPTATIRSHSNEIESVSLLSYLKAQGIVVQDSEASLEFNVVMKMVKGMKDRQCGVLDSDEYLYLNVLVSAIHSDALPENNGGFDDLLSQL